MITIIESASKAWAVAATNGDLRVYSREQAEEWNEVSLSEDSEQIDEDGSVILEALYEQVGSDEETEEPGADAEGEDDEAEEGEPDDDREPEAEEEEEEEEEEAEPEEEEQKPRRRRATTTASRGTSKTKSK